MQTKKDVSISGLNLEFIKDYKADDKLRKSLNRMTEKIFGFSFETGTKPDTGAALYPIFTRKGRRGRIARNRVRDRFHNRRKGKKMRSVRHGNDR